MSQRPNVIIFFTDQQRWDTTGVHDNPLDLTPNFDRMAQRGTHARYTFTPQPVCGPSRAVMQTGMYATANGSYRNMIPLSAEHKTLAQCFNEAGYETGYIGKWHLADGKHFGTVPEAERGGYKYWLAANLLEFVSDAYDTRLYDNEGQEHRLPGYRVDAMTDAAIRYIDSVQDKPFYLFLSFLEPHHQNHTDSYPAPDGYEALYRSRWIPPDLLALGGSTHQHLAGYYGMVKRLDEALGRLLDALKSMDILENTIVVFTSDHGNHFKTRNAEYKRSGHESSIRVPMAMQGAMFNGGGQLQQLISLIDLPPTLLDAVGIPIPEQMQGHSFLPLLSNSKADWQAEVFVQISESQVGRVIRTHRWKYGVVARDVDAWKESCSDTYDDDYLYDLSADPYELHNHINYSSHQAIVTELRQRLIQRMVNAGEQAPTIHSTDKLTSYNQLSPSTGFPYFPPELTDPR